MNFDINLILIPLLAISGAILLFSKLGTCLKAQNEAQNEKKPNPQQSTQQGASQLPAQKPVQQEEVKWWLDYSRSLFPIILFVVIIRSFIIEPYQIPSSSMVPTLVNGDFILVNKFTYGLRLPITNYEFASFKSPSRGDIMVFNFPHNNNIRYIKRVVGLPGDTLSYTNKTLSINGQAVSERVITTNLEYTEFEESLDGHRHTTRKYHLLSDPGLPSIEVPDDHYFVMGDNRDNSNDSRYWGFVPHTSIVGEAFYIWMNWQGSSISFKRTGSIE